MIDLPLGPLEPAMEARVQRLLDALDRARNLEEYRQALVAIGTGGEAGEHATWRLRPPYRTFGGYVPAIKYGALSWSYTHLLVITGGLRHARLVPRRGDEDEDESEDDGYLHIRMLRQQAASPRPRCRGPANDNEG